MKKILAVLLSLLMLMMSMAVYATETEHVHEECCCGEETAEPASEIQPRGMECGYCGKMTMSYRYSHSTTSNQNVNCTHGAAGYDVYRVVTPYYTNHCTTCGLDVGAYAGTPTKTLIYCPLY